MEKEHFLNRVRLRHLQCFVTVAQEQNLGKAAERLNLSQPAVSKTLTELEQMAGQQLVVRGRFGARLTTDGEHFLAHALSVTEALDDAARALSKGGETRHETLVVSALPTVAPDILPLALTLFREQYPHVRVQADIATNNRLLEKLKAGETNVAVGRMADPQLMVGLSFELLYVEPLVAVVRPEHSLLHTEVSLAHVLSFPLVVSASGTVPRHNTDNWFKARGRALPDNCLETLSVSVARLVVMQSDAVWFASTGAVQDDLARGLLVALPLGFEGTEEPVGLLHRSDALSSPALQAFMKILRGVNRSKTVARSR
jgi:LysR family transcriptional regulator, pca operon transcriptional activator